MATPKEIQERLSAALYWIDSISGFAGWDGKDGEIMQQGDILPLPGTISAL